MTSNQKAETGLSIVISNWNGRSLLERFLPSVVASTAAFEGTCQWPSEIVIADDASEDGTRAWLAAQFPRVRCESSPLRSGAPATANRGVRLARYPLVYVMNNDVALEPTTLPVLLEHFVGRRVFAVSSQVYDYNTGILCGGGQLGEFRRGFLGIHRRYFVPSPSGGQDPWLTLWAASAYTLYDREKFLALGGFDELFTPYGWEDVELSLRAWKQGFELHYEPRSVVWHRLSSTMGPRYPRRKLRALNERGRLLTHWLHLDTPAQVTQHSLFLLLKLLAAMFVGGWDTWSATAQAVRRWDEIKARRQALRAKQQRTLDDVVNEMAKQLGRLGAKALNQTSAPVRPYLTPPGRAPRQMRKLGRR